MGALNDDRLHEKMDTTLLLNERGPLVHSSISLCAHTDHEPLRTIDDGIPVSAPLSTLDQVGVE